MPGKGKQFSAMRTTRKTAPPSVWFSFFARLPMAKPRNVRLPAFHDEPIFSPSKPSASGETTRRQIARSSFQKTICGRGRRQSVSAPISRSGDAALFPHRYHIPSKRWRNARRRRNVLNISEEEKSGDRQGGKDGDNRRYMQAMAYGYVLAGLDMNKLRSPAEAADMIHSMKGGVHREEMVS